MAQRTASGIPQSPASAMGSNVNPPQLPAAKLGERAFERIEKTSAEFFAITYGALVRQMFVDHNDNADVVNAQLDLMGERMGVRLIEEYAARSGAPACRTQAQAAEAAAKIGMRMFLGIAANVEVVNSAGNSSTASSSPVASSPAGGGGGSGSSDAITTYSITFDDNPLSLFVELPDALKSSVWYSNVLCGVLRGALGQVGFLTQVQFVRDVLRGDEVNEIRVRFQGREKETFKVDLQK